MYYYQPYPYSWCPCCGAPRWYPRWRFWETYPCTCIEPTVHILPSQPVTTTITTTVTTSKPALAKSRSRW